MPDAAQAVADKAAATTTLGEQPPDTVQEPVIIDLDTGEPAKPDVANDQEAAEKVDAAPTTGTRKTNRMPANARIRQLTEHGQRMEQELERLRGLGQTADADKLSAQRVALSAHAERIDANIKLMQRDLKDAIAEGDAGKQAQIQTEISGLQAEKSNISGMLPREEPKPAAAPSPPAAAPKDTRPPAPPELMAYLNDRPFLLQGHADFDPELFKEATAHAAIIESRYKREGRGGEIGRSQAYFDDVDDRMAKEHPDLYEAETPGKNEPPTQRGKNQPGQPPVTRGGNGAGGDPGGAQVPLSGEERTFAQQMGYRYNPRLLNGAMKPHRLEKEIRASAGQLMSPQHAEIHHAWLKREQALKKAQT